MRSGQLGLALLVVLLSAERARAAGAGLDGLDRLYFERVAEPGPPSLHADAVRSALPANLEGAPGAGDTLRDAEGYAVEVSIEDFPLPGMAGGDAVLRQVIDPSHRIHEVWWALYRDGRRQDLWYFEASPERTDGKALANPAIEAVRGEAGSEVAIDILCTMFRPQGAEWTSAYTLMFEATPDGVSYRYAVERYGMSRGYDTGEVPPATYWIARRSGGVVEVLTAAAVSEKVVAPCEADAPDTPEGEVAAALMSIARCVTSKAKVQTSTRSLDTPAFIERGPRPPR